MEFVGAELLQLLSFAPMPKPTTDGRARQSCGGVVRDDVGNANAGRAKEPVRRHVGSFVEIPVARRRRRAVVLAGGARAPQRNIDGGGGGGGHGESPTGLVARVRLRPVHGGTSVVVGRGRGIGRPFCWHHCDGG